MRRLLLAIASLALLIASLPAMTFPGVLEVPVAEAQAARDDEVVVLTSNGRIVVQDPFTPTGIRPVAWQSEDTGWQNVATGDFNGDGDAEIIALRGSEARAFDPIVPSGGVPVTFSSVVAGQVWELVVTGDIDGDGRDEIMMTRTTSEGDSIERLQAFDSNPAGTSWTLVFNEPFGVAWDHMATGDVDADGRDELAAIRYRSNPTDRRITIWDPSNNWVTLHDRGDYSFEWLTIEIANVDADPSNKDELLLTRTGTGGQLDSFLVFRCCSGSSLIDVTGQRFNPPFFEIAAGDINASGDDEVFLLRDTANTSSVALISRNFGSDPAVPFETLVGQGQWKKLRTGDTDGDGRAELAVMSPGEYRIYTQPHANLNFDSYPGGYIASGNFSVGNIDGAGIPLGPVLTLSRSSIQVTLESGSNRTENVSITNTGDSSVITWTATVVEGSGWLSVNPPTGNTPGTLQLRISAAGLLAGDYQGRVRVSAPGNVQNSPQEITVALTVTAPQFSASPGAISWFLTPGDTTDARQVLVIGPNIVWNAGVVPVNALSTILEALESGATVERLEGSFRIEDGSGVQDVPAVDWVDVEPSSGVARQSGTPVMVSLIDDRVPLGVSRLALVFVADQVADPRAIVVDMTVLNYDSSSQSLLFLPNLSVGQ